MATRRVELSRDRRSNRLHHNRSSNNLNIESSTEHTPKSEQSSETQQESSTRSKKGRKRKNSAPEAGSTVRESARSRRRSAPLPKRHRSRSSSSPEPVAHRTRSRTRSSSRTEGASITPEAGKSKHISLADKSSVLPAKRCRRSQTRSSERPVRRKVSGSNLGNTTGTCASARSRRVSGRTERRGQQTGSTATPSQPGMSEATERGSDQEGEDQAAGPSQPSAQPDAQGATGSGGASAMPTHDFLLPTFVDDDGEMDPSRLQALLEARGLPPHIMSAFGSRMQHLLHKAMPGTSKVHELLEGLQSSDEGSQLSACMELGSLLVMGNEDTLAGFPLKHCVGPLTRLVDSANPEISLSACRALYNMLDTLPRSSVLLVDSVPTLVNKLKDICIMDVAEQAMRALEMISRRHPKVVLQSNAVEYALSYLDFMSVTAQRSALQLTANCCQAVQVDSFCHISQSVRTLVDRLAGPDKRCVESVIQCFSLLVMSLSSEPRLLEQLAAPGLLEAYKNLYQTQIQVISSSLFVTSLRTLCTLCDKCPDLAAQMLKSNLADTLCFLLAGDSSASSSNVELVPRSADELCCLVSLIGSLLPPLPATGIFGINSLLKQGRADNPPLWQWKDDSGAWRNYSPSDCRMLELAREAGQTELSLTLNSRSYSIDLRAMHQASEETGRRRQIERREPAPPTPTRSDHDDSKLDGREKLLKDEPEMTEKLIQTLLPVVYRVYSSSAGPGVRHKCLQAMLKMLYFSDAESLEKVLRDHSISSHIAGMLGSSDYKIVVGALQMADVLLHKLPAVFSVFFLREGVVHEMEKLRQRPMPDGSVKASPATPDPRPFSFSLQQTPTGPAQKNIPLDSGQNRLTDPRRSESNVSDGTSDNSLMADQLGLPSASTLASPSALTGPDGSSTSLNVDSSPPKRVSLSSGLVHQAGLELLNSRTSSDPQLTGAAAGGLNPATSSGSAHSTPVSSLTAPTPVGGPLSISPSSALATPDDSTAGAAASAEDELDRSSRRKKASNRKSNRKSKDSAEFMHATRKGKARDSSRPQSAGSKAAALLASLHPSRWAKHAPKSCNSTPSGRPSAAENAANKAMLKEKLHTWCQQQAIRFLQQCEQLSHNDTSCSLLQRATDAVQALHVNRLRPLKALRDIAEIVSGSESDLSPFELLHSGLVHELTSFLTYMSADLSEPLAEPRDNDERLRRVRAFTHVFLGAPESERAHVAGELKPEPLHTLVTRLHACSDQLEQFEVKVTEVPGSAGSNRQGGSSALKFFHSHQIKCQLARHPSCRSLREWHGGPVKIEPLALISAVERYLVVRGYARPRGPDADVSDDSHSEDDLDDPMGAMQLIAGQSKHKLEFVVGEQVVPHSMTIYQAIRQFGSEAEAADETDSESIVGGHNLWIRTHTLWYRPASDDVNRDPTPKRPKSDGRSRGRRDELWHEGQTPAVQSRLERYLQSSVGVSVSDPSLPVLTLLNILYGISQHWAELYPQVWEGGAALDRSVFMSTKLTSKALRQLQDPLVIMTGNLPQWLKQLPNACPFLLSFEVRQLLFYVTAFDRDRVMMRLQDAGSDGSTTSDSTDRVMPRHEMKKKHTVSRADLLPQAEKIMDESAANKAFIEIQYENEEGTGLGPTLEFYSLVSNELHRSDLEIWHGESRQSLHPHNKELVSYVFAPHGMFPLPLAKSTKPPVLSKVKSRFKFLGKFLAKALMDGRLVDLRLSGGLGSWLLGEEASLGGPNGLRLAGIDPVIINSLEQLHKIKCRADQLLRNKRGTGDDDGPGCELEALQEEVDDLCLNFVLPGPGQIELQKGGKDLAVTLDNLADYLRLVYHWLLVRGVWRQLDALRDGFEAVFPLSTLKLFYPNELEQLLCGSASAELWEARTIAEATRCDHGYTSYTPVVEWLFTLLSTYTPEQRRQFVQFVTGAPNLPVGGFKSLSPALTVVRKTLDGSQDADTYLPSVMTCRNYLKLPEYSCYEVLERRMQQAISDGKLSFHLS